MNVRRVQPVLVSIAVHGGALAAIGGLALTHRADPVAPAPEPLVEITLLDREPTTDPVTAAAVAMIGADSAQAAVGASAYRGAAKPGVVPSQAPTGPVHVTASASVGTGAELAPGAAERDRIPTRDPMRMRGPELHPAELKFDPAARPAASAVQISGKLHDHGRGAIIPDLVTTVTVDPDGAAHFHDKPDGEIHLQLPIMSRAQFGNMLRKWYEDPYAQTRVGKTQDMSPVDQAVEGTWNSGLSTSPDQRKSGGTVPIAAGSFDVTAWAMKKAGVGDPYEARKRALLDSTRDERAERGGSFRAQQYAKSSEIMQRNLDQLWRSNAPIAERREALFELWDECVEGDGPQAEAGARARAQVIGWIRAKLPRSSADAFTTAEIAAFEAKRSSQQHFCPYE